MMLPLELLLFCPPSRIRSASHTLAEGGLYLGHPASYDPTLHGGAQYSNPHSGIGITDAYEQRRRQNLAALSNGSVGLSQNMFTATPQRKAADVQKDAIDKVFEAIQSGVDMAEVDPATEVKTSLYKHQKQALAFLIERERFKTVDSMNEIAGNTADEDQRAIENGDIIALWRRKFDAYGRQRGWHNLVTGVDFGDKENRPPPQCRGAILGA